MAIGGFIEMLFRHCGLYVCPVLIVWAMGISLFVEWLLSLLRTWMSQSLLRLAQYPIVRSWLVDDLYKQATDPRPATLVLVSGLEQSSRDLTGTDRADRSTQSLQPAPGKRYLAVSHQSWEDGPVTIRELIPLV
ncbi:hypothetical protein ADM96_26175 [Burkholderia sp. ST111]|nr:hypothetical protein ADM96_26175 [Burkholderia sp. ST111]